MTCGDFIDLITTWESKAKASALMSQLTEKERQNADSNLKKARTEVDMYRTPT